MWDLHLSLGRTPDLLPQSRRRAYSDPRQRGASKLPLKRRAASPPNLTLKTHLVLPPARREKLLPGSPTSSGYGSCCTLLDGPQLQTPTTIHGKYCCGAPNEPFGQLSTTGGASSAFHRSPNSSGYFVGMALGSPLGSGPLNGSPLSGSGLSPVSETTAMCSSPNATDFLNTSSPVDILPMRRQRLPSLSEVPSVAPIPENLPLMDTPPRPPLRQEDLEPLPIAPKHVAKVTDEEYDQYPDTNIGSTPGVKVPYQNESNAGGDPNQTTTGISNSGQQTLQQQLPDKGKQQDDGDPFGPPQGSFRPRSGTWSMANSRKNKLKQEREEEAKLRQRRKSGDDLIGATGAGSSNGSAPVNSGQQQQTGFFDSFRPRSKSDAKAIMQSRVRRKSGDDVLNATSKEKEKKKEASPGFLESFRPRSKSDAARSKKPNIISTVKNAVQHSLVSPSATTRSGRRSGEATPVEVPAAEEVYHTWHAGAGPKTTIGKVWELFRSHRNESTEERQRRKSGGKHEKGQLVRRHSMEPERKRNGSGSSFGHTYLRGEDPNQAAIVFRDCRGLPAAAPFLENIKRSELEEDESQILVKFFKYHTTYDLIPTSAKLVIFDTRLQVKKAFYALVYNGVRAAPLWDAERQQFVGMLTITDFIRILQSFYNSPNRKMEELEEHRLEMWRTLLNDDVRKLISITPNECLYEAIRSLIHHKIHRLPVIDPSTGNVLYIITHKRILKFLFLYINELPKPSILMKSLRELNIGTYDNIETAKGNTLIIEALNKFVERRISALPIVDDEGKLVDIYAKFDVINLAAEGTYHNLDVTLQQANEYRNEWFEGVLKCNLDETMEMIMERIVRAEVHRLVVVDKNNKVIGIISLSDILNELVLKPCHDDPASLRGRTVGQMESALNGDRSECFAASGDELNRGDSSSATPDLDHKTGSEESMGKSSWGECDNTNIQQRREEEEEEEDEEEEDRQQSSSTESIEANKYEMDVNKIDTIGQQEIGPISG